jgi:hypothetical protein
MSETSEVGSRRGDRGRAAGTTAALAAIEESLWAPKHFAKGLFAELAIDGTHGLGHQTIVMNI